MLLEKQPMLKLNFSCETRVEVQDAAETVCGCFGSANWSVVVHVAVSVVWHLVGVYSAHGRVLNKPQQLDFKEIAKLVPIFMFYKLLLWLQKKRTLCLLVCIKLMIYQHVCFCSTEAWAALQHLPIGHATCQANAPDRPSLLPQRCLAGSPWQLQQHERHTIV